VEYLSLTPQDIFEELVKGNEVVVPFHKMSIEAVEKEAQQLQSHLTVIKHRAKKVYSELGLDFNLAIIKFEIQGVPDDDSGEALYYKVKFFIGQPEKKQKKYSAYVIEKVEKENNDGEHKDNSDGNGSKEV